MKRTILLLLTLGLAPIASAQVYSITDLGPLSPTAINAWGQVVGNIDGHAFIWTQVSHLRGLGTLNGGTSSYAASINDRGGVTGTADGPGTVVSPFSSIPNQACSDLPQPFLWTARDGMQGLGTLGFPAFYADDAAASCTIEFHGTAINDRGRVVGYTQDFGSYQYGWLWTGTDNMSLFGGTYPPTFVLGVSNAGQIVGQSSDLDTFEAGTGHATAWDGNGNAADLGTLGGGANELGFSSAANGANDLGQVVGWSSTGEVDFSGGVPTHAVLWAQSGATRDLGTLSPDVSSTALKINSFGQVIGSSGNTVYFYQGLFSDPAPFTVTGRPFVWSERTGMRDLNTLIQRGSGWILKSVSDINVWGQIVGSGTLHGQPHGFLLTPRVL
jgi:probable HAF family extracellular repeat protein